MYLPEEYRKAAEIVKSIDPNEPVVTDLLDLAYQYEQFIDYAKDLINRIKFDVNQSAQVNGLNVISTLLADGWTPPEETRETWPFDEA